jgi:hypothetical protein
LIWDEGKNDGGGLHGRIAEQQNNRERTGEEYEAKELCSDQGRRNNVEESEQIATSLRTRNWKRRCGIGNSRGNISRKVAACYILGKPNDQSKISVP